MADQKQAATITVPGVDFAEMARAVVAAKIAEGLAVGNQEAVQSLVMAALTTQVTREHGNKPQSYERDTVSWVEYVAGDLIRTETKKALADHVNELRPAIQKAVAAELKRNTNGIAKALVSAYAAEAASGYRVKVSMQFEQHER